MVEVSQTMKERRSLQAILVITPPCSMARLLHVFLYTLYYTMAPPVSLTSFMSVNMIGIRILSFRRLRWRDK